MDESIRIIKSLENSDMLINGFSETIKHEMKKLEGGFLGMLLVTLGASVLGNMLTGKRLMRAGKDTMRAGRGYNVDKNF